MNQPLFWDWKQVRSPDYVAVCGLISARLGTVFMNCKYGSFDNESIRKTLALVKRRLPQGHKWALFMDNATIHVHGNVMAWCETNGVPVVLNAKYRPDLMGIEFFWREAKNRYRHELTEMYAGGRNFDNLRVVTDIVNSITQEKAKKWALVGWQHLYRASLVPDSPHYQVDPYSLQQEYLEKREAGRVNPQDSHLFGLDEVAQRKLFVKVVFTVDLPREEKKKDDSDSEWSPHKMPLNELL